jgi:hypothetical protein
VKKPLLIKIAAATIAVGVFTVLFMRSLEDTRTAPYTVERAHLESWTLVLEPASAANAPLLVLRPSPELAGGLFKQIFSRAMESLNSPTSPSIPVVLRGEYDRVVGDQLTQEAMLAAAKTAGVEATAPVPRCVVHRHVSEPGGVRQAFLVFFDAPSIAQFRRQIGLDPDWLSPVMFVAGAGADFNTWLPQRVDSDADCLAPIETGQS